MWENRGVGVRAVGITKNAKEEGEEDGYVVWGNKKEKM